MASHVLSLYDCLPPLNLPIKAAGSLIKKKSCWKPDGLQIQRIIRTPVPQASRYCCHVDQPSEHPATATTMAVRMVVLLTLAAVLLLAAGEHPLPVSGQELARRDPAAEQHGGEGAIFGPLSSISSCYTRLVQCR